jgi:Mrp family chromosome partitioning ATPase
VLASQVDAVVLVCSATDTTWQALERSTEALQAVGTRLGGVVLNRFDAKSAYGSYGYSYGYGYGYGYGYYNNYYYGDKPVEDSKA